MDYYIPIYFPDYYRFFDKSWYSEGVAIEFANALYKEDMCRSSVYLMPLHRYAEGGLYKEYLPCRIVFSPLAYAVGEAYFFEDYYQVLFTDTNTVKTYRYA